MKKLGEKEKVLTTMVAGLKEEEKEVDKGLTTMVADLKAKTQL